MNAFEKNLESEINASLTLAETEGKKVLIVAVYSEPPQDPQIVSQGGLCRAVSEGTTRRDARAFLTGLKREVERLEGLLGE